MVSNPNTTVEYASNIPNVGYTLTGMVQVTNSYNLAAYGDSGGPWIYYNNNTFYLTGIQSGRWVQYNYMYFTPYARFSAIGFTPKLN